mmetsp:Transcript_40555/g.60114  ORF Transcript_40555/g.60114 Transcript_40555/m.60114 type:complete len:80 (-) Transcript_40555:21-260(-)
MVAPSFRARLGALQQRFKTLLRGDPSSGGHVLAQRIHSRRAKSTPFFSSFLHSFLQIHHADETDSCDEVNPRSWRSLLC